MRKRKKLQNIAETKKDLKKCCKKKTFNEFDLYASVPFLKKLFPEIIGMIKPTKYWTEARRKKNSAISSISSSNTSGNMAMPKMKDIPLPDILQ